MDLDQAFRTKVGRWFTKEGFKQVVFNSPTERIVTDQDGHTLVFKLRERADHDTYYKEAKGGSLIVFEVSNVKGTLHYGGYCPILLFGIWELKLGFKANAGWLSSYRQEGYRTEERFRNFIGEQPNAA